MISKSHKNNVTFYLSGKGYKSVGVDIEEIRYVHPNLRKIYYNSNDNYSNVDLLKEWTVKEASFKAICNLGIKLDSLKDVWVDTVLEKFGYKDLYVGYYTSEIDNNYIITKAYIND